MLIIDFAKDSDCRRSLASFFGEASALNSYMFTSSVNVRAITHDDAPGSTITWLGGCTWYFSIFQSHTQEQPNCDMSASLSDMLGHAKRSFAKGVYFFLGGGGGWRPPQALPKVDQAWVDAPTLSTLLRRIKGASSEWKF